MKEPIEDVQVNQLLKSRCCARVARAAKAELGVRKCPQRSKPELRQLEEEEAIFLAGTRTDSVSTRYRVYTDHIPTLFQLCSDSVPTLYRLCTDPVPSLYGPYTDPVLTLYRLCIDPLQALY